ncbi:chondroitin sulfate proteoglycan 5 isoform X2 [Erinaceus europaeus]|uniref:Chondroitin sulfate proteoglycan 5 isoform X2 n=1 Tax=Erinaceus europaeus TaxID=9365 RepID=A0ABM3YI94_ERIEU|nr:chondroitin sulfate proteoglycan 5 isoform X2 [Erinaceus europaeus]
MGRAGGGGGSPGRGPPPLLLLGAALVLVLVARAAPAREAGSAVEAEAEEPGKSVPAWEPRANSSREQASPPAAGEDRAAWAAPGPGEGAEEALEASAAVTDSAWLEADGAGPAGVTAEAGSGDARALPATARPSVPAATPEVTQAGAPASATAGPRESPSGVWPHPEGSSPEPAASEPTSPLRGSPEPAPDDDDDDDVADTDYFGGAEPGDLAGGETPSWSLLDLYDDFTPFDESDFYPTTSFYDDLDDAEDRDAEDRDAAAGGDPGDERAPTAEPTDRPPRPGSSSALRPRPPEPGPGENNGTECRHGFVRHNGSCRSLCDLFPSYCHNGGQCYLVDRVGAFCRCNTQDYIWHKGMRCESIITDFQVMCVAVGSAALVLLLLFMMTVFFAKKLYLLKTENTKLRRTNKFRTPSELHNDNFSLSTIAEGSHPNQPWLERS